MTYGYLHGSSRAEKQLWTDLNAWIRMQALQWEPAGRELLADLGVPAQRLLALCAHEGMLPSDVTAEICQALGCGDELEELREV